LEGTANDSFAKDSLKSGEWDMQGKSDQWKTPEQGKTMHSDSHVVGNKFYSLIEEESNHSKWEEFRNLAKQGAATEECANLLKRMELEVSEDEEELMEDGDVFSLEESGILPRQIEEWEDRIIDKDTTKKNQKRKTGLGPIPRAARPRDGRTMLEKAQDLKKTKNLERYLLKKLFCL
jgi:hypothetical protein